MAVAALIMGIAGVGLRQRFEGQVRRVENKLNGTIHYLFNRAAVEARTYRLAFDLEKQTYWVEVGEGDVLLKGTQDDGRRTTDAGRKTQDEEDTAGSEEAEGEEGPADLLPASAAAFGPAPNLPRRLAQPVAMPTKVRVKDLFTTQSKDPISTGMAYIHFFPQGFAEHAIINLTDAAGDRMHALEVNPLTGFTKIHHEYRELK